MNNHNASTRSGNHFFWQSIWRKLLIGMVLLVVVVGNLQVIGKALLPQSDILTAQKTMDTFASSPPELYYSYLPVVATGSDLLPTPFGVENNRFLLQPKLLERVNNLSVSWVRMNNRISWRELQPEEGSPIQWGQLAGFERELLALRRIGVVPVVVVDDYPRWATILPSSCAAIRADKFEAFATFMRELVLRYSNDIYNVYHWELGNEPDVDPRLIGPDNIFGCWGDIDDPYYNGEHYGEMLKVVSPVMYRANPDVYVWIGGLLLATPITTEPNRGRPELFFKGILEAGAAQSFDVVPYHWYPQQWADFDSKIDLDTQFPHGWQKLGGGVLGKAAFLRDIMAEYGVQKPLVLNESGFICPGGDWCNPPDAAFFDFQADLLVRMMVRMISDESIHGMAWYTLEGPGWRWGGLLENNVVEKPVYLAYRHLIERLGDAYYKGRVNYAPEVEAYRFRRGEHVHDVLWSVEDTSIPIRVPQNIFIQAFDRDGTILEPETIDGSDYIFNARFEAIYIIRQP